MRRRFVPVRRVGTQHSNASSQTATPCTGRLSFATAGPNSRTTQFFINLRDNRAFDRVGSTPFGRVTSGLEAVEALYSGYGDGPPRGRGPDQSQIRARGNAYLAKDFPKLDYIRTATIEK